MGRGYLISNQIGVTAIGASMIDITGRSFTKLLDGDSNPGAITVTPGGVTRNIAENLALLDVDVTLITALCRDAFGEMIRQRCLDVGIDIAHAYYSPDGITTTYLAILDEDGDMSLALSDTKALDQMPLEHLLKNRSILDKNELIVIDAALPDEIINYLVDKYQDQRLFVDPVSVGKARSIKNIIGKFDTLKCNQLEAAYLADLAITDEKTLEQAAEILLAKGLRHIFITRGKQGAYYQNSAEKGYVPSFKVTIQNATGAGDAFTAGVVYGALKGYSLKQTARFANALSAIALTSASAVSPLVSIDLVNAYLEKRGK
ncbi:Pseudouridine kinase [bioreactor metagenome]|uniref:Pseudouridine kinase n=1 Tax=bioreactor metagenome TaxID=1076179 RepID=A0A645AIQ6_9ZZZZ